MSSATQQSWNEALAASSGKKPRRKTLSAAQAAWERAGTAIGMPGADADARSVEEIAAEAIAGLPPDQRAIVEAAMRGEAPPKAGGTKAPAPKPTPIKPLPSPSVPPRNPSKPAIAKPSKPAIRVAWVKSLPPDLNVLVDQLAVTLGPTKFMCQLCRSKLAGAWISMPSPRDDLTPSAILQAARRDLPHLFSEPFRKGRSNA